MTLRPLTATDVAACEAILRALPGWFGIEPSIVQYVRDVQQMETIIAEGPDGGVSGFLTLKVHNAWTAEIQVMAVRPGEQRSGFGRALVERAVEMLRARGFEYLQVKTLGPSRPCAEYELTRDFYAAVRFRPLEENQLWGEVNPCLILVRHLTCEPAERRRE